MSGIKTRFGNIDVVTGYQGPGKLIGTSRGPNWWQARWNGLRLLVVWPTRHWRSS